MANSYDLDLDWVFHLSHNPYRSDSFFDLEAVVAAMKSHMHVKGDIDAVSGRKMRASDRQRDRGLKRFKFRHNCDASLIETL